jgi:RNA polymerase sigma-70 factor (ECF subfamily)
MDGVAVGYGWMQEANAVDAFDRLFLSEYSRVVTVAYRIVNDSDEAEDVAQEVFADFCRRHPADASYASAWLYRAAVHTALNALRGKRRRARREELHERNAGEISLGRSQASDPLREVEAAEARRDVRSALARLPERSAALLALRYSGMSYAEVAETLCLKTNQIGTLLRRAEVALRKEIDRETSR